MEEIFGAFSTSGERRDTPIPAAEFGMGISRLQMTEFDLSKVVITTITTTTSTSDDDSCFVELRVPIYKQWTPPSPYYYYILVLLLLCLLAILPFGSLPLGLIATCMMCCYRSLLFLLRILLLLYFRTSINIMFPMLLWWSLSAGAFPSHILRAHTFCADFLFCYTSHLSVQKELQAMTNIIDYDKDGMISFQDFEQFCGDIPEHTRKAAQDGQLPSTTTTTTTITTTTTTTTNSSSSSSGGGGERTDEVSEKAAASLS